MPEYIGYTPTGTANSSVTRIVYSPDFPASGTPGALPFGPAGNYTKMANTSSNTVALVYSDSLGNIKVSVGSVGTDSITWGTAGDTTDDGGWCNIASISNNQVVVTYIDGVNSNYGTAVVGTISGTSISFGTPSVYESAQSPYTAVAGVGSNKVVIAYRDDGNSYYGTAVVGTVSGTSISFGTPVDRNSEQASWNEIAYVGDNKVVVVYSLGVDSPSTLKAAVGTVSGTSISFGTSVTIDTGSYQPGITYLGSNKVAICYGNNGDSKGTAVIGTVSGTSISFGTPVDFETASLANYTTVDKFNANTIIVGYRDSSTGYTKVAVGNISGTDISFGTPVTVESASSYYQDIVVMNSTKSVIAYRDDGNSQYATTSVINLGGNENVVDRKYNSGIWSFEQVLQKRLAGTWPSSA